MGWNGNASSARLIDLKISGLIGNTEVGCAWVAIIGSLNRDVDPCGRQFRCAQRRVALACGSPSSIDI